jgi:hypothetical protein
MELTSGVKWLETCNPGDVNRNVNDKEQMSENTQQQTCRPIQVSSNAGNISDMELTSEIKWLETCNPGDVNKYVNYMKQTSQKKQKETSKPTGVSSHIGNTINMELTSGVKQTEIHNPGAVNKYVDYTELTRQNRQKQCSKPVEVSSHIGNATDMELTNEIKLTETCNPGDVNKYVNDMKLTSEKKENQMSAESTTSMGDLELRNELREGTVFNPSTVTDLSVRDVTDMKLGNVSNKQIYDQSDMVSECGNSSDTLSIHTVHHKQCDNHTDIHSETNNISGTEAQRETISVSFSSTSNMDGMKLSKEGHTEDMADVSYHSLLSYNTKTISKVKELHSIDAEVAQHSEPTACISSFSDTGTDKMSPSDCAEAETPLRQITPCKPSTVHALGYNEEMKTTNISVTLVTQTDSKCHSPFSEITHPKVDGRYCKQIRSIPDIKKVNESANCNSMELNVRINTSSNTSVPAVSFSSSIPPSTKKLKEESPECYMKLSHVSKLNQELVKGSIQNTADKLDISQGRHGLENSKSPSDKVTKVRQTPIGESQVMEENLSMTEARTYTYCTTGVEKFATAVKCDNVGNAVSHSNKQFQNTKGIQEKTPSQKYSVESTQMFSRHKGDSFLLEELGCKHEHSSKQPALNEYTESSDLHVRIPPEVHDDQTVKEINTAAPRHSKESTDMVQNEHHSLLQSTLTSIPDEMELSIIKDLSFESNESYKELVDTVKKSDEIIREKMFMTSDENAMPSNSQSAQSNSEKRALLLQEVNNSEDSMKEQVITRQESAKHLESETVTRGQNSNQNGMFIKSCTKQTDGQIKPKELKDTNEVPASSVEDQIKAKELRLVITCY